MSQQKNANTIEITETERTLNYAMYQLSEIKGDISRLRNEGHTPIRYRCLFVIRDRLEEEVRELRRQIRNEKRR